MFTKALDDIYVQGGWCTVFDDWWYLGQILGLEKTGKKFLMNARSNDIPFVLGAQRPAGNRLVEIFDQAEHLLFFRDNDEQNLRRIGGVGWLDSTLIRVARRAPGAVPVPLHEHAVRAHVPVEGAGALTLGASNDCLGGCAALPRAPGLLGKSTGGGSLRLAASEPSLTLYLNLNHGLPGRMLSVIRFAPRAKGGPMAEQAQDWAAAKVAEQVAADVVAAVKASGRYTPLIEQLADKALSALESGA